MKRQLPLIYIASLRRTGSTVLSEALTSLPHSFIFREPKFSKNKFGLKQFDNDIITERYGLDLKKLRSEWENNNDNFIASFKSDIFEKLKHHISQMGVKEIKHDGWEKYLKYFPDMKVILTGRDPRDIYISLYNRVLAGRGNWKGEFSPETVARELNRQFNFQKEMSIALDCFRLNYETLCNNPLIYNEIKKFAGSKIPTIGNIGCFVSTKRGRISEFHLHGNEITKKSVNRWRKEKNIRLYNDALRIYDLMGEYNQFWGY